MPLAKRLHPLFGTAWLVMHFCTAPEGWKLSIELCRQRMVLESRYLRTMVPCEYSKGKPWLEWGPGATHAARAKSRAM